MVFSNIESCKRSPGDRSCQIQSALIKSILNPYECDFFKEVQFELFFPRGNFL